MQKCFFFAFLLLLSLFSNAQKGDVKSIEFSIWVEDISSNQVHCRALIQVSIDSDSVSFDFHPHQINYIRNREGRLKQELPHSQQQELLSIKLPSKPSRAVHSLEIDYTLNLSDPFYHEIVNRAEIPLGLNVQNMFMKNSVGIDGAFFPSISNDPFLYSTNVTLPKDLNSGTNGELEFTVNTGDRFQSQFWRSNSEINARDFYLILGEFKEFDVEDIEDEYDFTPPDLTALKIQEERNQHKHLIKHISIVHQHEFEDGLMLQLDSLSQFDHTNPILSPQDLANPIPVKDWKEQIVLFKNISSDSLEAAKKHFNFHSAHQGSKWTAEFLERKWQELKLLTDSAQVNPLLFHLVADRWIVKSKNQTAARSTFLDQLANNNVAPRLEVNYVFRDENELIFVKQDTSIAPPLSIPFTLFIYTKDSVYEYDAVSAARPLDTLYFPQSGAPQALRMDFGKHFPGILSIARSDIYDLYLFSNAKQAKQRKAALQRLFLTTNPNLFSTVLGIAMDSKDPEIRLQALKNSVNLNIAAQYKLKSTLLQLAANDAVLEIRQQAQNLVMKYYPNK